MNYFEKDKIYLYIIVLLSVFLLSLGAALLYHTHNERQWSRDHSNRERPVNSHRMMASQLGLDENQMKQFNEFRSLYMAQTRGLISAIDRKKSEMLAELSLASPDTMKLSAITDSIGILHREIMKTTAAHFLQLKKICSPDQQIKMEELFKHMLQFQNGSREHSRHMGGEGKGNSQPFVQEDFLY
jgi:periplasmic protein CpxP/Spy